ncbi:hypothetical protein P691DRAFT_680688 [Macrolepiota fuliginosa MF-IS2]|uniref:Uncharacterized protein n=1 Tax=Macrolepiota fuliginosa MF-IS2 TaxID=1400762 RepID=A0A9P6BWF9_9AGAR|nr:hypothetical protein P691DRAFT_680688 [Macrolepiota fuliginosa MF-IS2]
MTERLVISTPNVDYLPNVNLGRQVISMCVDGRWGAEDWAQWPQWYFDGQDHFAYILRRPAPQDLKTHPLRRLWWNMEETDFSHDPALNAGRLMPHILQEFNEIRTNLMKEVDACICSDGLDWQKLQKSAMKMHSCITGLHLTVQPYLDTVITVAAAQRYCLETRALLDKITNSFFVDNTILGCITDHIPTLYELYKKGVPVWFVRPPSQVPDDLNIIGHSSIT